MAHPPVPAGSLMVTLRSAVRRIEQWQRFVRPMDRATDVLGRMAALPFADVKAITGGKPTLILAPHSDDESLGCGGFISQACAAGEQIDVAILTDGTKSHPSSRSHPAARLKTLRETEAAQATSVLGLPEGRLCFLEYPDAAAPRYGARLAAAGERLARLLRDRGIGTVCASWRHDPHCDHLAAHRIVSHAARLTGCRHLSYAVWGWTLPPTTWLPRVPVAGVRLDIAGNLAVKRRAIACHKSQITGMISDDPAGFRLPQMLLDICDRPFETYLFNDAPPLAPGRWPGPATARAAQLSEPHSRRYRARCTASWCDSRT